MSEGQEEEERDDATFWAMLGDNRVQTEPLSPPPAILNPLRSLPTEATVSLRKRRREHSAENEDDDQQRYEQTPRREEGHRAARVFPPRGTLQQQGGGQQDHHVGFVAEDSASVASSSRAQNEDNEADTESAAEMDTLASAVMTQDEALMNGLQKLQAGESGSLDMNEAFEILLAVARRDPRVLTAIPIRLTASPLAPSVGAAYLACRRLAHRGSSEPQQQQHHLAQKETTFPVAFQSILNSDLWWLDIGRQRGQRFEGVGLASRPMSRSQQLRGGTGTREARSKPTHGYRGRMYSLVRRDSSKKPRKSDGIPIALLGDAHLVCVWRDNTRPIRTSSPPPSQRQLIPPPPPPPILVPPLYLSQTIPSQHNDRVIQGHLRVSGDLFVDGTIYGRLQSANADYAEWFASSEPDIRPGSVVSLTPHRTLTLDTGWQKAPLFVVSAAPSVSANAPLKHEHASRGAMVAFLGQVPVRCRGKVSPGDSLIASGLHDGTAVAFCPKQRQERHRTIGLALSSSNSIDHDEATVICLIRWDVPASIETPHHHHHHETTTTTTEVVIWLALCTFGLFSFVSVLVSPEKNSVTLALAFSLLVFAFVLLSIPLPKKTFPNVRIICLALLFYPTLSLGLKCLTMGPPIHGSRLIQRLFSFHKHTLSPPHYPDRLLDTEAPILLSYLAFLSALLALSAFRSSTFGYMRERSLHKLFPDSSSSSLARRETTKTTTTTLVSCLCSFLVVMASFFMITLATTTLVLLLLPSPSY